MVSKKCVCSVGAALSLLCVNTGLANNSLTAGLSLSYDYDAKQYDVTREDDDYRSIAVTPLLHYVYSSSETNRFELRAAPSLKYDFIDYSTDWDNNLYAAVMKSVAKNWVLNISNSFVKSDYSGTTNSENGDISTPALSPDVGRTRYWRNTAMLGTDYYYAEESSIHAGFNYTVLRNDDSEIENYNDYDRYSLDVNDHHRFNRIWKGTVGASFTQGDFEERSAAVVEEVVDTLAPEFGEAIAVSDLSSDLKEYGFWASLDNTSSAQNTYTLGYSYSGSKYDEILRTDNDIHQARFTWQHQNSPQLSMTLGAGPSYGKDESSDGEWGANGIAEVSYLKERGSFLFAVEKGYELNNFDGTSERGVVDFWDTRLSCTYQMLQNLALDGILSYRWERNDELAFTESSVVDVTSPVFSIESYDKNRYTAGLGLSLDVYQYYSASIRYTYTKLEADRDVDSYYDNRIVLSLSWNQEFLRW